MRKWTALAQAGPARYRASRAPSARALRALVSSDLPDESATKYLRRIYDLTTRDDVELLDELGLLVEHDPEQRRQHPAAAARGRGRAAREPGRRAQWSPEGGLLRRRRAVAPGVVAATARPKRLVRRG